MKSDTLKTYAELLKEKGMLLEAELFGQEDKKARILTYDSREVKEDTIFICKGAAFKEEYLQSAVEKGAVLYVSEKKYSLTKDVPYLIVKDVRKAMPVLADFFYHSAWEDMTVIGIGGTTK